MPFAAISVWSVTKTCPSRAVVRNMPWPTKAGPDQPEARPCLTAPVTSQYNGLLLPELDCRLPCKVTVWYHVHQDGEWQLGLGWSDGEQTFPGRGWQGAPLMGSNEVRLRDKKQASLAQQLVDPLTLRSVFEAEASRDLLRQAGWKTSNIDATVVAEKPHLAPYMEEMRQRLAQALQIETGQVSVKATTSEKLGFAGRGEGISALAVAAIEPR